MPPENPPGRTSSRGFQLPPWFVLVLFVAIAALSYWQQSHPQRLPPARDDRLPELKSVTQQDQDPPPASRPDHETAERTKSEIFFKIEHQTIRDLNGRVVFEGTIDLEPTLARIERGGSDRHRNDGTVFQNRERRLPSKPHGYYREFVHPTPKVDGPGPQRIIIGQDGDIWYTPNHYQSFIQIKTGERTNHRQ